MCQCRLISCNEGTSLVGEVDNEGGCACVGSGSLYLPLSFAVNIKLLKKKKVYFFKCPIFILIGPTWSHAQF